MTKLYTTGQALEYLKQQMIRRPNIDPPNWRSPNSGVSWLRLHRERGTLDYQIEQQGGRPKFLYAQEALDEFLDALSEVKVGRPEADFSMLTEEEKRTLTAEEIAKRAGVGRKTVYMARMRGNLPRGKMGRPYRRRAGAENSSSREVV